MKKQDLRTHIMDTMRPKLDKVSKEIEVIEKRVSAYVADDIGNGHIHNNAAWLSKQADEIYQKYIVDPNLANPHTVTTAIKDLKRGSMFNAYLSSYVESVVEDYIDNGRVASLEFIAEKLPKTRKILDEVMEELEVLNTKKDELEDLRKQLLRVVNHVKTAKAAVTALEELGVDLEDFKKYHANTPKSSVPAVINLTADVALFNAKEGK